MVLEIANLSIKAGGETAFEQAVSKAVSHFEMAEGFKSIALHKCVEAAGDYKLFVVWDTLEDHTVKFRQSEHFAAWRALVSDYFAVAPSVQHFTEVNL